ncbi:MAG: transcription antitermination factor NusB [Candidatus Paraimprobicoccus trichonymphae]|uniref:Transcription antitermination protein NusB n=1 Tax=Candidatus Paraimprobicoccus trichonymphae TaxID=3033793 RepID=A0AA48I4Y5_9FIRM|nr:MAG: transcription antitermination factor NusB [Candidatus Paraimprobicoccus trichonymphae]
MSRRKFREQAFKLIFENMFNENNLESTIEFAEISREEKIDDFAKELFFGVKNKEKEIDDYIGDNIYNWKKDRISKIALAILRMSIYEIFYIKKIPISVSINEAIEITKKYGSEKESSFINGTLGSIVKNIEISDKTK